MAKTIQDLMTWNPTTISPDAPIQEAARLMKSEDVGSIPIVEGDRLVGTITDRDIVIRAIADAKDPTSTGVGEIASRDLVTIAPDQSLDEALHLMATHQIRRLPVCEEDGRLVGIVAQADVAREAKEKKIGEVVEEISR